MTKCPECDSEVAELDTFCPYCGISLNPVVLPADAAADEMASTIVMSSKPKLADVLPVPTPAVSEPSEPEAVSAPPVVEEQTPSDVDASSDEETAPEIEPVASVPTEIEPAVDEVDVIAEPDVAEFEPDEPAVETSKPADEVADAAVVRGHRRYADGN